MSIVRRPRSVFVFYAFLNAFLSLTHGWAGYGRAYAEQDLVSVKVDQAPVIDGNAEDPCWARATALRTHDPLANIDITIKSVYTQDQIFVLVEFPDETENRAHKTMMWDASNAVYKTGPQREDVFVIKWSMEPYPVDLTISADEPYMADIWYWKANRTDHAGHADDKMHIYGAEKLNDSKQVMSKTGRPFYLHRLGDSGSAAYEVVIYETYLGEGMPKYNYQQPQGSRADVKAKGLWQHGIWTVEFERKLDTENPDDVQFTPSQRCQLGVSRYEIAGRPKDPNIEQPYFGSGEITENLWLIFE